MDYYAELKMPRFTEAATVGQLSDVPMGREAALT